MGMLRGCRPIVIQCRLMVKYPQKWMTISLTIVVVKLDILSAVFPKNGCHDIFMQQWKCRKNIKFRETLDFMFEENIPGDVTKENRKPINVIWVEQRLQTTTCMCDLWRLWPANRTHLEDIVVYGGCTYDRLKIAIALTRAPLVSS